MFWLLDAFKAWDSMCGGMSGAAASARDGIALARAGWVDAASALRAQGLADELAVIDNTVVRHTININMVVENCIALILEPQGRHDATTTVTTPAP